VAGRKKPESDRGLTPEERDLWAAVTKDARALDPAARRRSVIEDAAPEAAERPAVPKKADAAKPIQTQSQITPPSRVAPATPTQGSGTDRRTQLKMRRGQIEIEGRIDLHGMRQAEARRALETFIASSAASGRRCVLVITGKGSTRPDDEPGFMPERERGVLREQVPRWLALPPMAPAVITWQPAARRHGGDGALYVLLRRKK